MKSEPKELSELKVKLIALVITAIVLIGGISKNILLNKYVKQVEKNQVLAMESFTTYSIDEDLEGFINNNLDTFEFYTNIFGISMDDLKDQIIAKNEGKVLNKSDLGNSNTTYDSLDKNLIDFLLQLKKENSKLFKQTYTNGNDYSKEYIYGLINYFSSIYTNVDYEVLASIAYIESGNLNSKYMLQSNNIFGGMSGNGLLKYQNIEFGTLSFVKLMSEKYYAKGLDTVEKIAKVYNLGSESWTYNVKKYTEKFIDDESITTINALNQLK